MEAPPPPLPPSLPPIEPPNPPQQSGGAGKAVKKAAGPIAAIGVFLAKFKVVLFPVLKFFPILLKTGGTMLLSIIIYTSLYGFRFAFGVVILIFVHECGHLLVAKWLNLKVSAPMFIPFFGAVILLKESPRNAWIESQVAIGGPILGTIGGVVCFAIYAVTGDLFWCALARWSFLINLFNLTPIGFLDGGRIATALSPWLWILGTVIFAVLLFVSFNPVLLIIFIMTLPRLFSLFRKKTPEEQRYFEVTPMQRLIMGGMYIGLAAFLVLGMQLAGQLLLPLEKQVALLHSVSNAF
jgi:Zn-dependent protease